MTSRIATARHDPDIAAIASLLADPVRASMLFALHDGRELCASDLAARAGASPQAASAHLAKLVAGGLLVPSAQGRRRVFRLASSELAHAMESLAAVATPRPLVALAQHTTMERLREARSCYDHLAGRLSVALTERFVATGQLTQSPAGFAPTSRGKKFFAQLGIDLDLASTSRRPIARACLDWTERRSHLAGSLGARVLALFLAKQWVTRYPNGRALAITPQGRDELRERFGIDARPGLTLE